MGWRAIAVFVVVCGAACAQLRPPVEALHSLLQRGQQHDAMALLRGLPPALRAATLAAPLPKDGEGYEELLQLGVAAPELGRALQPFVLAHERARIEGGRFVWPELHDAVWCYAEAMGPTLATADCVAWSALLQRDAATMYEADAYTQRHLHAALHALDLRHRELSGALERELVDHLFDLCVQPQSAGYGVRLVLHHRHRDAVAERVRWHSGGENVPYALSVHLRDVGDMARSQWVLGRRASPLARAWLVAQCAPGTPEARWGHVLELFAPEPRIVARGLRFLSQDGVPPPAVRAHLRDAIAAASPPVAEEFVSWLRALRPAERETMRGDLLLAAVEWPPPSRRRWMATFGPAASPGGNLAEALRLDRDRAIALLPDVAIEALAQRIAEFAYELNDRRRLEVLAALLAADDQERVGQPRRALAPFRGERLRAELQARLGSGFVDVVGPAPWTGMLELDLAVARLAGVEVRLDGPDLVPHSTGGLALWGSGGGALADGGGYGPLPPHPGPFAEVAAAWLRVLPREPEGVAPRLLRLVLDLDGGDPSRAVALLRAWEAWPDLAVRDFTPVASAHHPGRSPHTPGPGADGVLAARPAEPPATMLLLGDVATWRALYQIARDLTAAREAAGTDRQGVVGDEFAQTVLRLERVLTAVEQDRRWWDHRDRDAIHSLWSSAWQLAHTLDEHGEPLFAPAAVEHLEVDGRAVTAFRLRAAPTTAGRTEPR